MQLWVKNDKILQEGSHDCLGQDKLKDELPHCSTNNTQWNPHNTIPTPTTK